MAYCASCNTNYFYPYHGCLECPKVVQFLFSQLQQIQSILNSSGSGANVDCVNLKNSHQVVSNCCEWMEKRDNLEKEQNVRIAYLEKSEKEQKVRIAYLEKAEKEQKARISYLEKAEKEQKERIGYLEEVVEKLKDEMAYLRGVVDAFKEETEADVQLIAAHDASPIPSHTALLARSSKIIKNMLDLDGCMSISNQIPFPELSYEELECLLEFLYSSQLPEEKFEKHIYALSKAAHKYEIPFLAKVCEKKLLKTLNAQNVLEALEISKLCSIPRLMELAVDIVVDNMDRFVNSAKYEEFAHLNPDLNLAITKAFVARKRNV